MAFNRTRTPAKNPAQTGARADGGLTQRQEAFCLAFVETGNTSTSVSDDTVSTGMSGVSTTTVKVGKVDYFSEDSKNG